MWNDLEEQLERCQARLREARLLLAAHQPSDGSGPGSTLTDLAATLLSRVEAADVAGAAFCEALRDDENERKEARAQEAAVVADLYRALGIELPASVAPPPEDDAPGQSPDSGPRRIDRPDGGGSGGNAPVGAGPRPPAVSGGGGAARTYEEALAPPRDP